MGRRCHYGDRLAPDDAAFLNSAFNHANETDDTHLKSPTHPAALRFRGTGHGGIRGGDGEKLLLAVIAAYEVQSSVVGVFAPSYL